MTPCQVQTPWEKQTVHWSCNISDLFEGLKSQQILILNIPVDEWHLTLFYVYVVFLCNYAQI